MNNAYIGYTTILFVRNKKKKINNFALLGDFSLSFSPEKSAHSPFQCHHI